MYSDPYFDKICSGSIEKLARLWGPINYQYVSLDNDSYKTKRDLLCTVNFGSYGKNEFQNKEQNHDERFWDTKIVRERLKEASYEDLIPAAYYSLAITKTHYFLLYAFYHADDLTHPNDLEGCLIILQKNLDKKPKIFGMVTIAHNEFVPYVMEGKKIPRHHPPWQKKFEIKFEEEEDADSVLIEQSKGKHALYSLGRNVGKFEYLGIRWHEIIGRPQNVIVYYPGEKSNIHTKKRLYQGKDTPHNPTFYYELIDILDEKDGLYTKYKDSKKKENMTFTSEGAFHTAPDAIGQAKGPWLWKPNKKWFEEEIKGHIWEDPAKLVAEMFEVESSFSTTYYKKMDEKI